MEFLKIYSPSLCIRELGGVRTIKQALLANTPTIGRVLKEYGSKSVEAYIKIWLVNLGESVNLKRPLKEHQIDECAYLIIDSYKNLTIADINIIFRRAKMGDYGDLYESMSMNKILRWFKDYFNSRCNVAGALSREANSKRKYIESKGQRSGKVKSVRVSIKDIKGVIKSNNEYKTDKNK